LLAIIESFDKMILDFYDPEDDSGLHPERDAAGQKVTFPS